MSVQTILIKCNLTILSIENHCFGSLSFLSRILRLSLIVKASEFHKSCDLDHFLKVSITMKINTSNIVMIVGRVAELFI